MDYLPSIHQLCLHGQCQYCTFVADACCRFSMLRHASHLIVQNKAVRFPARQQRDLSEYKEGGTYNAYGQAQVRCGLHCAVTSEAFVIAYVSACKARCNIANKLLLTWSTHLPSFAGQGLPPGSSGALRGEYYGPGSPPAGNGHFAPSPLKPQAPGARHLQGVLKTSNTHGHILISSCRCASRCNNKKMCFCRCRQCGQPARQPLGGGAVSHEAAG